MHAPAIAAALVEAGFDIVATAAEPSLRGSPDAHLLDYATAAGRALVTENVADYAVLAAGRAVAAEPHAGLILTNPSRFNRAALAYPGDLIAALRRFLDDPPISGDSWTWWL